MPDPVFRDSATDPHWHSTNLVGVPTALLASPVFNEHPVRLTIAGVETTFGPLLRMLEGSPTLVEAGRAFHILMAAMFDLEPEQHDPGRHPGDRDSGIRRFRSSYLRLLKGWGWDANSREGAVLKGWVESRFGLLPTFHKQPIRRLASPAWMGYVEEKMNSRFHNNAILTQLDALYTFCQWALHRAFTAPYALTLHRGVNDFEDMQMVQRLGGRRRIVRLNNLTSFTDRRDVADCFGDTLLTVQVPSVKVLYASDLLPGNPLRGEGETLVIGGDFEAEAHYL